MIGAMVLAMVLTMHQGAIQDVEQNLIKALESVRQDHPTPVAGQLVSCLLVRL